VALAPEVALAEGVPLTAGVAGAPGVPEAMATAVGVLTPAFGTLSAGLGAQPLNASKAAPSSSEVVRWRIFIEVTSPTGQV
jgi:hypothetical protein